MNRSNLIPILFKSVFSTHQRGGFNNKVTPFSLFSHQLLPCNPPISHQKLFCTSNPKIELENLGSNLTHQSVVYVLKKLDKNPRKSLDFFNWVCDKNGFKPSSLIYCILIRVLISNGCMKEFWGVVKEMKEKGFYIDEQTYLTILGLLKREKRVNDATALTHFYNGMRKGNVGIDDVKSVVGIVSGLDSDDEIEVKLKEVNFRVSEGFVLCVFKELERYPLRALRFFEWVRKNGGYEHDGVMYNAIAKVLAQCDSINEFWDMVRRMRNEGHEIDIDTYVKISRRFQKCNLIKDAVELFEFMMDGPYKPSVQDCTLLLKRISVDPDMDLVFRVVNKYEGAGNILTKPIYDGIHRSLTVLGKFEEAQKIVETMKNTGCEPDNITYSQIVFGLCNVERLEEACLVLDDMEKDGCIPDIKTWTILIQGYCGANQIDNALLIFAKMMEKNIDPDADVLEVLINGFLAQKKFVGAYTFLLEMVEKASLKPWQATYKLMIEKLLEEGKLEEGLNLLSMMKKHGYPPFPEPFVRHISRFGSVDDAMGFLNKLSVKDSPSSSAYVHVIRSFFDEGRHLEAKDLLYKSPVHIRSQKEIGKLFGSAKSSVPS